MEKTVYIIILCYFIISCNFIEKIELKQKLGENKEKLTNYEKELKEVNNNKIGDFYSRYKIKPKKLNKEYLSLLKEYNKQKNQLSFGKESYSYNGKKFFLKNTPEQIEEVFGKPFIQKIDENLIYKYSDHKMELEFKYDINKNNYFLEKIYIFYEGRIGEIKKFTPYNAIKLRGIPYPLDKSYYDFLKLTNLKKDDYYYEIIFNEKFLNSNNCLIYSCIYTGNQSSSGTPYGFGLSGRDGGVFPRIYKLTFSLKYLNNLKKDKERELKYDIDEFKDKIKYYQKKLNQLKNK